MKKMKKIILFIMVMMSIITVKSQNVQMFGSFNKDGNFLQSTIEQFKSDKYGCTYFFFDLNYSNQGPTEGYMEISRELKNWESPLSIHFEYNGGLNAAVPFYIQNAYLAGGTYSWNDKEFTKGISFSTLYKYIQGNSNPNNFQFTTVWYLNMLNNKLSFTGFADFWKEKNSFYTTNYVFHTQPQLWYNVNKVLSIGTEIEVANNLYNKGVCVREKFGIKLTM
jgi:hypothetical protein